MPLEGRGEHHVGRRERPARAAAHHHVERFVEDAEDRVVFLLRGGLDAHIDGDDDVGQARLPDHVGGHVVQDPAVDQHLAVEGDRREHARDGDRGAQGPPRASPSRSTTASALRRSVGHGAERRRQRVEVQLAAERCRDAIEQQVRLLRRAQSGGHSEPAARPKRSAGGKGPACLPCGGTSCRQTACRGPGTDAQSTSSIRFRISCGAMPVANAAPTRPPMLVPPMTSTGTRCSSSHWRTPMWAKPRAPPPPRARPMRGRGVRACGGAAAGSAPTPAPPVRPRAGAPRSTRARAAAQKFDHSQLFRLPVYSGAGTIEIVTRVVSARGTPPRSAGPAPARVADGWSARAAAGDADGAGAVRNLWLWRTGATVQGVVVRQMEELAADWTGELPGPLGARQSGIQTAAAKRVYRAVVEFQAGEREVRGDCRRPGDGAPLSARFEGGRRVPAGQAGAGPAQTRAAGFLGAGRNALLSSLVGAGAGTRGGNCAVRRSRRRRVVKAAG